MKKIILFAVLLCLSFTNIQAQTTRYLKPVASGTGDGSSWANASADFQLMINNSAAGDQLFMTAGTYQAGSGQSFTMKEGVKIYGGFAGTETLLSQRNWTTNVTILRGDNAPVIRNFFNGLTTAAILDGFTITNGNAAGGAGGGMYNETASPTISNCIFSGNSAYFGGGMMNGNSTPKITNCTFKNNIGTVGGGMYNNPILPDIQNCTFNSNTAPQGGAMYNYNTTGAGSITNCTFSNNTAANGGALYNYQSIVSVQQTTFTGNQAANYNTASSGNGGAVANEQYSTVSFTGCTFTNNTSYQTAGAVWNSQSSLTIADSYFSGNIAGYGAGAIFIGVTSTGTISRTTFLQNTCATSGGALFLSNANYVIANCIISGNSGQQGAAVYFSGGSPTLTNCLLTGNYASIRGGAICSDGGTPTLNNCTISGNNSPAGSIYSNMSSTTTIYNSIIWNNSSAIVNSSSTTNVQYSIVQGGYSGTGNQNADPYFFSAPSYTAAPFSGGDFHVYICSPAVNTGSNALVVPGNTNELSFAPRIIGPAVDLGVYEFGIFPSAANIIYVNPNVVGGANSGSSWNDARRNLAEVLRFVKDNQNSWTPANPLKILVAKGTYNPLYKENNSCATSNPNDRDNTFLMTANVTMYGGFDPANGIDDLGDTRIFGSTGSILSGEIGAPGNGDNNYHVVVFSGTGNNCGLDGFTIRDGNANVNSSLVLNGNSIDRNNAGGIYIFNSAPVIANCNFLANSSAHFSGALYSISNSNFTVNNCTFSGNSSQYGGAIFNDGTTGMVNNTTFSTNTATFGGAIYDHNSGSTSVSGSSFTSNSSSTFGGAVYINGGSAPVYTNCTFSGNSSSDGGAVFNNNSTPTMTNCSFANNNGTHYAGAIYNYSTANPILNNCSFSNNTASLFGGALYSDATAYPKLARCDFAGNSSAFGGAMTNGGPTLIESCSFTNNLAASYGGAVYNLGPDQQFSNCLFSGNQAINAGGGGGAIFNNYPIQAAGTLITLCTFYNNSATFGGAVHNYAGSTASILNSIFWNNSSTIAIESGANAVILNSLVQGGYAGSGNINLDPLFINPSQPKGADGIWATNDDGFHVQPCSPVINTGNNGILPPGANFDLAGQPRIQYSIVDMGAYEANSLTNAAASNIVSVNTTVNAWQIANAATYYSSNCTSLVAAVAGNGTASAINGNTTAKVWIEPSQPLTYVKRHYEITPQTNAATATGTITLYFTQAEFDAFNTVNLVKLPQGPADASGKSRLLIEKRSGTSSDNSGNPFSYSGTVSTINPADADIIWNTTNLRWEISFPVTGFSGFFVKTQSQTLPLQLESFEVKEENCIAMVKWITSDEESVDHYEIEQTLDGITYNSLQTIKANNTAGRNIYNASLPALQGNSSYRLKMVDINGKNTYSIIQSITTSCTEKLQLYPNPVRDRLHIRYAKSGTRYTISNNNGMSINQGLITNQLQDVTVSELAPGIYYITLVDKSGIIQRLKFLKQ